MVNLPCRLTGTGEHLPVAFFEVDAVDDTSFINLASGVVALDSGVDPATVDSAVSAGTSLDGVDRSSSDIDRGAYEQGL